jgi:hypothetical protein
MPAADGTYPIHGFERSSASRRYQILCSAASPPTATASDRRVHACGRSAVSMIEASAIVSSTTSHLSALASETAPSTRGACRTNRGSVCA